MTNLPKISVIIPSYNQGKYIERTLLSILKQNYSGNTEIIVSDGGSTDNTIDIVKGYNIIWWSEKDKGYSDAVNKGLKRASGDIIAIQSSDDYYLRGAFNKAAKYFQKDSEYGFISGNDIAINSDNSIARILLEKKAIDSPRYLLKGGYIPQHATFIKKKAIDKVGGLKISCDRCGDADLFYRILHYYKGLIVKDLFSVYQIHDSQRTQNDPQLWLESEYNMIRECENDKYYSVQFKPSNQEINEFMMREKIFWESLSGNRKEALDQIHKLLDDKSQNYSEWLITFALEVERKINGERNGLYSRIFKGNVLHKLRQKYRYYFIKTFNDLAWYQK
jgi:glycosyltransferase involved in cell wall biosynthesis